MPITHQITSTPGLPISPGGDILGQLSGMLGKASALLSGGVGLPGLQSIGSQIASMGGQIATAGGSVGVDTAGISGIISSLGSLMSTTTSMSGMSSLVSSLTSQLSSLTNLLNPSGGGFASILHSHILDKAKGIVHSAFQGQHTVALGSGGIDIQSILKVAHTAPTLPHNGFTLISDALAVTKGITGASFGMLSDVRLKSRIKQLGPVLETLLRCRVKTFDVKAFDFEAGKVLDTAPTPSIGLIAQELQELFPELVRDGEYLSIDYDKLIMVLLAAFIEHAVETRDCIETMQRELAELRQ